MAIKKIMIQKLNKIENQMIMLAPRLTAIFSPNGTGKSSLAQALTTKKEEKYDLALLFTDETKITLFKDDSVYNELYLYSEKTNEYYDIEPELRYRDEASSFKPVSVLFSTNSFSSDHLRHTSGSGLINISKVKRKVDLLIGRSLITDQILIESENFLKFCKPSNKIMNTLKKVSPFTHNKILVSEHSLNSYRDDGARADGIRKVRSPSPLSNMKRVKEMSSSDFRKHVNKMKWRSLVRFCTRGSSYDLTGEFDIDAIKQLSVDLKIKSSNESKEYKRQNSKNLSVISNIRGVIAKTHLKGKFILNEDFTISNKDGKKIILSSGELKFLTFLNFIFSSSKKELIILDDPFSSFDISFQDYVVEIVKDMTENRGRQILFLTHNANALLHMSERINPRSKTMMNSYLSLLVDKSGVARFEKFVSGSLIQNYLSFIFNEELTDEIRIIYSRKFLEHIVKASGYNSISEVISGGTFNIFGKSIPINLTFQKLINRWSHDDRNLYDQEYQVTSSRWVINNVMKIISELKINNP